MQRTHSTAHCCRAKCKHPRPMAGRPAQPFSHSPKPGSARLQHNIDDPNAAVLELTMRDRGLLSLPALLSQLPQLERLDLSANQLTALPDAIGNLSRLDSLLLDDNQLTALPDAIGALANLRWLALD